ncbi:MAG: extracellular solute-binding protein [Clostridia bacterium]|nr:extracellular solute-binding protein [Clostridia bacterium]
MRKIAFLMCLLMVLSVFAVACSNNNDVDDSTTPADTTVAPSGGDTENPGDVTTEVDIYANLPTGSYPGFQFDILTSPVSWTAYENMCIEAALGEPVEDEIYYRNVEVSEALGITIAERITTGDTEAKSIIAAQAMAGDQSYDMFAASAAFSTDLAIEGYLIDLNDLLSFDFEKPWWDSGYNESIKLGEKMYAAFGDLSMSYVGGVFCMAFNPDMIAAYGLDNPYDIHAAGNWTYETIYQMMSQVTEDKNGDGTKTTLDSDVFGIVGHNNQLIHLVLGSGESLIKRNDAEGTMTLYTDNERFFNAFASVVDTFVNFEGAVWAGIAEGYSDYNKQFTVSGYAQIFNEGRSLFLTDVMAAFKDNREAEIPYQIIDFPKYDSAQSDYYSVRYSGGRGITMISGFNDDDLERNATVIENMAAYNHKNVIPQFIEVTLYYKYAKDQQSLEMLQGMLSRTGFSDLAFLYNWGSINTITTNLFINGRTTIASSLKAIQTKFNKEVASVLEDFE